MNEKRCLFCYQLLAIGQVDFHPACSQKMFGQDLAPLLYFEENELESLGIQVVRSRTTVTGVQPKLSLDLKKATDTDTQKRFTLVGLWGSYILKPPGPAYPFLPEVEDLTMHLAETTGLKVVPHSLIRLKSGALAYITKRIDRQKNKKIHMEDFCQITNRLAEQKYQGSYEQIGKAILTYSEFPGLDAMRFFELVLFSFLTGNADMHLKNFSLIQQSGNQYVLSPAYDLVATKIVNPLDLEEMALTLNGRKREIKRSDFEAFSKTLKLSTRQMDQVFSKMQESKEKWSYLIQISFIPLGMKEKLLNLIEDKFLVLY